MKKKNVVAVPLSTAWPPSGLVCVSSELLWNEEIWESQHRSPYSSLTHPHPARTPVQPPGGFLLGLPSFPAMERISGALSGLHTHHLSRRAVAPCVCRRVSQQGCWPGTPANISPSVLHVPEEPGVTDSWRSGYCVIQKEHLMKCCLGCHKSLEGGCNSWENATLWCPSILWRQIHYFSSPKSPGTCVLFLALRAFSVQSP